MDPDLYCTYTSSIAFTHGIVRDERQRSMARVQSVYILPHLPLEERCLELLDPEALSPSFLSPALASSFFSSGKSGRNELRSRMDACGS